MNGDIHALSGAYAVDALDDDERAEFERHLADCESCSAEVGSLREAAALLAETTATAPSPELRQRVLGAISTVRPLPPERPAPAPAAPVPAPEPRHAASVTDLSQRRRRRVTSLLAAAAAVVAIGAGGVVWSQLSDDPPGSRIEQITEASDAQRFTTDVAGGGTATVVRSAKLNEAYLMTRGVSSAPDGQQYVLWLQHGTTLTPAGVVDGSPNTEVVFSGDATSADGAAVSVEDAGPAPASPSDDVVATFDFSA